MSIKLFEERDYVPGGCSEPPLYFLLYTALHYLILFMPPYLAVFYAFILMIWYWYVRWRYGTKKRQLLEFGIIIFAWIGGIIFYFLFYQA